MSYTNFIKAMELAAKCKFYTTVGGKSEEEIKMSEKKLGVSFSTQCREFYEKYGYLMDAQHGKDTELLVNILKETGLSVGRIGKLFFCK